MHWTATHTHLNTAHSHYYIFLSIIIRISPLPWLLDLTVLPATTASNICFFLDYLCIHSMSPSPSNNYSIPSSLFLLPFSHTFYLFVHPILSAVELPGSSDLLIFVFVAPGNNARAQTESTAWAVSEYEISMPSRSLDAHAD